MYLDATITTKSDGSVLAQVNLRTGTGGFVIWSGAFCLSSVEANQLNAKRALNNYLINIENSLGVIVPVRELAEPREEV